MLKRLFKGYFLFEGCVSSTAIFLKAVLAARRISLRQCWQHGEFLEGGVSSTAICLKALLAAQRFCLKAFLAARRIPLRQC